MYVCVLKAGEPIRQTSRSVEEIESTVHSSSPYSGSLSGSSSLFSFAAACTQLQARSASPSCQPASFLAMVLRSLSVSSISNRAR